MATAAEKSWIRTMQAGVVDVAGLKALDRVKMDGLVRELDKTNPIRFLDRRHGDKWEIGVAESGKSDGKLTTCLFITAEAGQITTVAAVADIQLTPPRRGAASYVIACGAGYSLYRDPDGWKLKLLETRTVRLSKTELTKYGWQPDVSNGKHSEEQA
jgi:hypothetical protein